MGTFHKVSAKYLPLYVAEFEFRYNNRNNPEIFGAAERLRPVDFELAFSPPERAIAAPVTNRCSGVKFRIYTPEACHGGQRDPLGCLGDTVQHIEKSDRLRFKTADAFCLP